MNGASTRGAAYLAAYSLWEAVQTDRHEAAVAELAAATRVAEREQWPEVEFVLAAADFVHSLARAGGATDTAAADDLVARAQRLQAPAMLATALGFRAITASATGDTGSLLAHAGRAVALLDDEGQPALDRCAGYVVTAAALNTLRLWELVDELYTRAADLEVLCVEPAQAAAVAVNRVITGLEWATALLELGEEGAAQERLEEVAAAVKAAQDCDRLPTIWRRDVEAGDLVVGLLRGQLPAASPVVRGMRDELAAGDDIEVLPILDAAVALALWRAGDPVAAAVAADVLAPVGSVSSGSRSFPLWVRSQVLGGSPASAPVRAGAEHTRLVSRLQWESRLAVLGAARAQIAVERRGAEHDRLSVAVNTDSLTGLSNRRPFDAWLDEASASAVPVALLLADVDDFKRINDTHGHDVGDQVLRRFGELLLSCVRPGDLAVRHGGDEFAVLLQGAQLTEQAALRRAEQLRAAVGDEPWSVLSAGLTVTASIGVATSLSGADSDGGARLTPARLYRAADDALYAAKRSGSGFHVNDEPGQASAGTVLSAQGRDVQRVSGTS